MYKIRKLNSFSHSRAFYNNKHESLNVTSFVKQSKFFLLLKNQSKDYNFFKPFPATPQQESDCRTLPLLLPSRSPAVPLKSGAA